MANSERQERRRFPRIRSENLVLVKKVDEKPEKAVARTVDVGMGGCRFVNDLRLGKNSVVDIVLICDKEFIEVVGKILYELPRDDGFFDVGVEFSVIAKGDKERLQRLVDGGRLSS